jgi:hypothetical protein
MAQRLLQRINHAGLDVKPLNMLVNKLRSQLTLNGPQRAVYKLGTVYPFMDITIYDLASDLNRSIRGPCLTHLSVKLTADR